jgi:hypothetical protein
MRPLATIAGDIRADWKNIYFGAEPYLVAMETLTSMKDTYGLDSADSIVMYFLANAQGWRGPKARFVKDELRKMLGGKK